MSDTHIDTEIDTDGRFEAAFAELVRSAVANDVDVRGSWVVEIDDDGPDFEALVVELDGGPRVSTAARNGADGYPLGERRADGSDEAVSEAAGQDPDDTVEGS